MHEPTKRRYVDLWTSRSLQIAPWTLAAAAPGTRLADAYGILGGLLDSVVMGVAQAGDLRANSLVTLAAEELVLHARTLARRLFGDERASVPFALSGGLLSKGSLLRKRLLQRVKAAVPGAQVREEDVVPVRGAVRDALRHLRTHAA